MNSDEVALLNTNYNGDLVNICNNEEYVGGYGKLAGGDYLELDLYNLPSHN